LLNASYLTRHGDWVMRMRFRDEITRETEKSVRLRLSARAFHPEARSHHPITVPSAVWVRMSAANNSHQFTIHPTQTTFDFPDSAPKRS